MEQHVKMCVENSEDVFDARILAKELKDDISSRIKQYSYRIGFRNTGIGQGANSALPIFAKLMHKMNASSSFNAITNARFQPLSSELANLLECPPEERDNFFERLFSGKNKDRKDRSDDKDEEDGKKKKGFFKKLFGKKDDN